ncbi:hypothetical protein [Pseudomonas paraeruginosa]|uniref:hypothetical protein n=1 Tax=Pseudomonas paraeruginosa TaxID=2994495 RepID=UPI00068F3BD7|nr:hypothetical protein [Pseudomonas paraeruginosa]
MKQPAVKQTIACAPEDLLAVRPDAAPGVPLDAINAACERAISVLYLLSGQFIGDPDERYADHVIANVIWDVQGTIEQIRTLVAYGNATSTPAAHKGGAQ